MSVGVGAQGVDLIQSMPFYGLDEFYLVDAGMINDGGSINIPWLLGLSVQMGNALTTALSRTAHVFCEPEYGFEAVGMNQNWQGAGSRPGGISISW